MADGEEKKIALRGNCVAPISCSADLQTSDKQRFQPVLKFKWIARPISFIYTDRGHQVLLDDTEHIYVTLKIG